MREFQNNDRGDKCDDTDAGEQSQPALHLFQYLGSEIFQHRGGQKEACTSSDDRGPEKGDK